MAVLAPPDWQYLPRDTHAMDFPSNNSRQQRSSPANDNSPSQTPSPHGSNAHLHPLNHQQSQQPPQQPYPYPVQQQPQGSWTPSISAQPFYPSFYQNPQQPPQGYPQLPQQPPYFDPANAQLAQWAYQQMMFNAQQQGFMSSPQQSRSSSGRNGHNPSPSNDYFTQNTLNPMFNPFPSGTPPPPHPNRNGSIDPQQQQQNGQYSGFHPYRRPTRQGSSQSPSQGHPDNGDWRSGAPNPPYARPDASSSTSSVNSTSSQRQRTNSNQSGQSGHSTPTGSVRSRNGSPASNGPSAPSSSRSSPSGSYASTPSPSAQPPRNPHHRNLSSSSTASSAAASNRPAGLSTPLPSATSTSSSTTPTSGTSTTPRPARPSPLSQGTFTAAEKRMSRDDSDLATMLESAPSASMLRSGGLKGRLRRALNFNAQTLKEEDADDDASIKASTPTSSSAKLKPKTPIDTVIGRSSNGGGVPSPDVGDDAGSTATVQTKKRSRAASLFNSRLNASTDNISLSSTVSSASVMIRKLGSMGKLARRNSLAGITSLFKDKDKKNKDKDKDKEEGAEGSDKKGKKKKGAKAEASEASVSHVTAELDRSGSDWGGAEMSGLSPAAKLARQHTLKSNAEAAAKAKAQQEAAAAAAAANAASKVTSNGSAGVPTWERNTQTRQGSVSPVKRGGGMRVNEDGTRVLVEDEDDERSDDDHYHTSSQHQGPSGYNADGWDDDEDWDGEEDEDVTIRLGMEQVNMEDEYEEPEPWAVDVRRSMERTRVPAKGILKHAGSYDQHNYMAEPVAVNRARSNSYNSHPSQSELGPLARIPSPDPDHIDGLHRHGSHSSAHGQGSSPTVPSLPPLPFDASSPSPLRASFDSPRESVDSTSTFSHGSHAPHPPEKSTTMFSHSNSSAPALSTIGSSAPTLTHRSATTPSKRLAFANNLSVYDTFSASVYDRRSEPATWSRLTPALAQRIKEELNSYKMEEMEVHAASRIHTQFFV